MGFCVLCQHFSHQERTERMRIFAIVGALVIVLALLTPGCGKKEPERQQQPPPQLTMQSPHSVGTPAVAGIRWSVPQSWMEGPPRQMRFATYMTQAAEGENEGAECSVSFFGASQGGTVDQNIDRWISQFENPSSPARTSKQINGLTVNLVKVSGRYVGMSGPMMQQSGGKKENFALLGAIVDAPEGEVFFKLTGPAKTLARDEGAFSALIESLQKN
jgi:hypothetical protein